MYCINNIQKTFLYRTNTIIYYQLIHFKMLQVTGGVKISTNETEMAQWLLKNGPISIGINANAMQFYMGGYLNFRLNL